MISALFRSIFTDELIITTALPLHDDAGCLRAIIDIDFKFNVLVMIQSKIPDEILE